MGRVPCANHTHFNWPRASLMAYKMHPLEIVLSQEMTEFRDTCLQVGCGCWSNLARMTMIAMSVAADKITARTSQTYQAEISVHIDCPKNFLWLLFSVTSGEGLWGCGAGGRNVSRSPSAYKI